jgi:hypothetical protein
MSRSRTYVFWLALAITHTWLFFEQSLGLNALIFSLILVAILSWQHKLHQNPIWWAGVSGYLVSAIAVFWHGNFGATMVYHLSSVLLAGMAFSAGSSFFVSLFNGLIGTLGASFITNLPSLFGDVKKRAKALPLFSGFTMKKAYLYMAPASVTVVFYLLYRIANPDFFLEIEMPELDLNFKLLFYAIFGAVIISPFFFPWGSKDIVEWDSEQPSQLPGPTREMDEEHVKRLTLEYQQGVIMFVMLNSLICFFLAFNILQIFIPSLTRVPASHSEQVHQGFETLIMSIVAAILLIMYYFRGDQNFVKGNRRLILLATAWIVLNGVLALFTSYKNMLYVDTFGFTYKRIWVFIGILLTSIGLYLTLFKINRLKTNWYLIRSNTWVLYFVFVGYALVDWDRMITWYNINYAQQLDIAYLEELGATKLPYLKTQLRENNPRLHLHRDRINVLIHWAELPEYSWKSQTMDGVWLRKELAD